MLRFLLFLLCLGETWAICSGNSVAADKPNIVFIMADDNNGQASGTCESPSFSGSIHIS